MQLVGEGAFAHVRNADDHCFHGLADALLRRALDGFLRRAVNDRQRVLRFAGGGAVRRGIDALCAEVVQPRAGGSGISQIRLVEQQHALFARQQLVQIGISAGIRQPRVAQLHHHIHAAELIRQQPLCFRHMSGIPVNVHVVHPFQAGDARECAAPAMN